MSYGRTFHVFVPDCLPATLIIIPYRPAIVNHKFAFSAKKLEKCTLPYRAMIEVKPMRKFKIPNIPATEPKSIRFPVDVISEVEHTIRGKDCTFSAFVVEAVRVALESLREEDEELDVSEKDIEEK